MLDLKWHCGSWLQESDFIFSILCENLARNVSKSDFYKQLNTVLLAI